MERESLIAQGESFLRSASKGPDSSLSKKISSLESLGFSPNEITEVLKRLGTSVNLNNGSNLKSLMLNNVIPSLIILGTGALVFFMTGGEDEIIEPLVLEEGTNTDDVLDYDRSGTHSNEDNDARKRYTDQTQGYDGEDFNSIYHELDGNSHQHQKQRQDDMDGVVSPEWVKELQLVTNVIAADVKIMKEALLKLSLTATNTDEKNLAENLKIEAESVAIDADVDASNDSSESSSVTEEKDVAPLPIMTVEDYLYKLRTVVREMSQQYQYPHSANKAVSGLDVGSDNDSVLVKEEIIKSSNFDGNKIEYGSKSPVDVSPVRKADDKEDQVIPLSGRNEEVFKLGCGALMMYVSKVLEQPSVPRYRKISTSNASFKALVLPLEGHVELLSAVGFKRNESGTGNFEWTWRVDSDQIVSKVSTKPPDESAQAVILTECVRLLGIGRTEGSLAIISDLDSSINDVATVVTDSLPESIDTNCVVTETAELSLLPPSDTSSTNDHNKVVNDSLMMSDEAVASSTLSNKTEFTELKLASKSMDKKTVTFEKEESVPAVQGPLTPLSPTLPASPLRFSDIMQIAMTSSAEKLKEKAKTELPEPEVKLG